MTPQFQLLLTVNILCVLVVVFFVNRMLRASSKYNWNPGNSAEQQKQRIIILKAILVIASTALFAALLNAFFG